MISKDAIKQYFDDLPNRWSANFLALLGLINFITIILGSTQSVYYRITNKSTQLDSNFFKDLYLNIEGTINDILNSSLSINEVLLILLFSYCLLLSFSKTKKSLIINLSIFFITLIIYFIDIYPIYNFMYSGEVGTLFKPTYASPYTFIILFLYLVIFFIEKKLKINIPNTLLKINQLYKILLKIFFIYSCFGLILLLILTLLN